MVSSPVSPGALVGLRVLDLSTFLAAPQVSAILADFGADVVKVEPPQGEALRSIGAQRNGGSLMWALASRNKRAVTCNLEVAEGRELLHRLIERSDVLVENFPPEMLAAWGCSWDELHARYPKLVMVSVSCYGQSGPLADRPGAGTLAEAFGGLTHMTGEADGPPMLPSIPLGDTLVALNGVIGALIAAWHVRVNGGPGQRVDVSMYEPILTLMQSTIVAWDPASGEPPPRRSGSRIPTGVPRNLYRCADDRWIVVSGTTDRQVARVLALIGHDSEADRAKFARSVDRIANADELDALVAQWVASTTAADAIGGFESCRVPVAPVHDVAGLLVDDHIAARRSLTTVHDAAVGDITLVSPSPKLTETPGVIRTAGPAIGAHNVEVYAELGLGPEQVAELAARRVL